MIKILKYIAYCLVGVFTLLPLQAQNIIRPKIAGPGNLWVNSYNGVLFFEQKDFETQNSAMPMQLRFCYNSSANKVDFGYGLGFSLSYEMRYREDVIGGVDILAGDGRTDHFIKYGDEYKAPTGVFSTLTRPTFDTYLLTTKDGTKYFFDNAHHHKVTAIEDRYGNITTFKYQDTLLIEIKDAVGHTITMSYTDGLLTQASASFSPGIFKYEYDGLRRLRKRIDPLGNVTLYDYSRQNKLDEITDANGNKTLIAYNNAGLVSRLKTDVSDKSIRYDGDKTIFIDYTEPNNVYSYYRWDDKGRAVEKVGLCCGIQSTLKYDDNNNVAQLIDANGGITTYTYDEHGNMLSLRDPLGYTEQYSYEPIYNQVSSFNDKNGNSYTFNYDSKGNLTTISGPVGLYNRYSYDEHGWQTMATDSKGGVTRITYNSDGTIANIVNADGGTVNYVYDSYGRLSSITDPMGNNSSYSYDDLNRIIKQTDALGYTTTASYDKVGNIVRLQDALNNIAAYTYDVLGNITSITDAMGNMTTYEYDGRSNIIAVVNPLGIKTEVTYNDRNKIESYTNEEGEKTTFDYDLKGNLIATMLPNGNVVSYEYDELDRLIEIRDNIGVIVSYEYDGNGNCLFVSDGLNRKLAYTYDALNRKSSVILPSGSKTQFQYDANGNLISIIDALGHVSNYEYDAMNRCVLFTNALNSKTQYAYDANGNMTRVTDAMGNVTTYSYNSLNQSTNITFANGRSLQYTYDAHGNVVNFKDRSGQEFKFNYNPLGKLITKTYPDGTTDNYTYDALGRMLTGTNQDAVILFSYDRAGRLLSENLNGESTIYSYDVSNNKRTVIYPSGLKIVEQLNARKQLSSIIKDNEEVVSISYNEAGQKVSQSYSNGIKTVFDYSENGWLKSIKDDQNIQNIEFYYDLIGNVIQRNDLINNNRTETYEYDEISQIKSFKRGSSLTQLYEFDLLGNRTKVNENGATTYYTCNNLNAYTSVYGASTFTPEYDANGNLIFDGKHSYRYGYDNKLISVDDQLAQYKYDALGRRIISIVNSKRTQYFYTGGQVAEEFNDSDTKSYIYGNSTDELLVKESSDQNYYYHQNINNSVFFISNSSGDINESFEYDPFGKVNFDNLTSLNNKLFMGCEYDVESDNYFFRARTYSPLLGRFLQLDPLTNIDGINNYTFVHNSPINNTDPTGYLLLQGGVSYNYCIDNTPSISNPPYNGPEMYTSPNAPEMYAAPSDSKPPKNLPNLNFEAGGCIADKGGICASFKRGVDKNGDLYEGFEISPVLGKGLSGYVNTSVGNDSPNYGFDTGIKAQGNGNFDGVDINGSVNYSTMNNTGGYSFHVGLDNSPFGFGGSSQSDGSGNMGGSASKGRSATVGGYFSWTWKVK